MALRHDRAAGALRGFVLNWVVVYQALWCLVNEYSGASPALQAEGAAAATDTHPAKAAAAFPMVRTGAVATATPLADDFPSQHLVRVCVRVRERESGV